MGIYKESPITYTAEEVFGEKNIQEWKDEGHWPPPPGIRVLPPKTRSDSEQSIQQLLKILPPHLRKAVEEALKTSE